MRRNKECQDSITGQHEPSEVEVESTNDDTTWLVFTCIHCEAIGRIEVQNPDVEWVAEEEDEDDEEEDLLRADRD